MHLQYNLWTASNHNENRHAQQVMEELGITYQHATPQTMGDSWWFWNCEHLPDPLPPYLTPLDIKDPFEVVGFGLNAQQAQAIKDYELKKQ